MRKKNSKTKEEVTAYVRQIKEETGLPYRKLIFRPEFQCPSFPITPGMLSNYANGYEPRNREHRRLFGMTIMVKVPACPRCGVAHVAKKCPVRSTPWSKLPLWKMPTPLVLWKLENREEF